MWSNETTEHSILWLQETLLIQYAQNRLASGSPFGELSAKQTERVGRRQNIFSQVALPTVPSAVRPLRRW